IGPAGGPSTWTSPVRATSGEGVLKFNPALAVDTDGSMQVVYESRTAKGSQPGPAPLDPPVGAPAGAGVGTSLVRPRPELGFTRNLTFPFRDSAPSGSKITGEATIINRGPVGTHVKIEYFDSVPGPKTVPFATRTIFLGPNSTYDLSQPFP